MRWLEHAALGADTKNSNYTPLHLSLVCFLILDVSTVFFLGCFGYDNLSNLEVEYQRGSRVRGGRRSQDLSTERTTQRMRGQGKTPALEIWYVFTKSECSRARGASKVTSETFSLNTHTVSEVQMGYDLSRETGASFRPTLEWASGAFPQQVRITRAPTLAMFCQLQSKGPPTPLSILLSFAAGATQLTIRSRNCQQSLPWLGHRLRCAVSLK